MLLSRIKFSFISKASNIFPFSFSITSAQRWCLVFISHKRRKVSQKCCKRLSIMFFSTSMYGRYIEHIGYNLPSHITVATACKFVLSGINLELFFQYSITSFMVIITFFYDCAILYPDEGFRNLLLYLVSCRQIHAGLFSCIRTLSSLKMAFMDIRFHCKMFILRTLY